MLKSLDKVKIFYESSTAMWLNIWGEHMHQGYYPYGQSLSSKSYHQAQIDFIDELLRWGKMDGATTILDAGCGVGGSSRYLAQKFGANVLGITNSPLQAVKGSELNELAKVSHQVAIHVGDLLHLSESNHRFDLIICVETIEHIPDKKLLLSNFLHLLNPGGRILIASLCLRNTPPYPTPSEISLLQKIYSSFCFSPLVTVRALEDLATQIGFSNVESKIMTQHMVPFWKSGLRNLTPFFTNINLFKTMNKTSISGVLGLRFINKAYQLNLLDYTFLQATKNGSKSNL